MSSLTESQVDLGWLYLHIGEILSPCWWSVLTHNALNACKYIGNFVNYRTESVRPLITQGSVDSMYFSKGKIATENSGCRSKRIKLQSILCILLTVKKFNSRGK